MKKNKKELKNADNSRAYKAAITVGCPICGPNKGCNRNRDFDNNWKSHRKNQWKN